MDNELRTTKITQKLESWLMAFLELDYSAKKGRKRRLIEQVRGVVGPMAQHQNCPSVRNVCTTKQQSAEEKMIVFLFLTAV